MSLPSQTGAGSASSRHSSNLRAKRGWASRSGLAPQCELVPDATAAGRAKLAPVQVRASEPKHSPGSLGTKASTRDRCRDVEFVDPARLGPGLGEKIVRCGPLDQMNRAEGLVLMLHGSGDTGDGMLPIAEDWAQVMPRVAFLMPSAPVRIRLSNWFGLSSQPGGRKRYHKYQQVEAELLRLLEEECRKFRLSFCQVALWGYSAGARMAGWMSLLLPEPCAALVLLHGMAPDERLPHAQPRQMGGEAAASRLPAGQKITEGRRRPPTLILAGGEDTAVPAEKVRHAKASLEQRYGFTDIAYIESPEQGHWIGDQEYDIMLEFLQAKLQP